MLKNIEKVLVRAEGWFMVALLTVMLALTFVQVLLRNLQTHGHIRHATFILGQIDWAEPMVRLSVLWLTFLGASIVTGENRHIKMDILSTIFPEKWLPFRELILCIGSALVCTLMFKSSLGYLSLEMRSGSSLFLGIPSWVTQIILPLGFLLMILKFLARGAGELGILIRGRA